MTTKDNDGQTASKADDAAAYHIVFVDIVKYSARNKTTAQKTIAESLVDLIRKAVSSLNVLPQPKYLPTGDGAAMCFRHNEPSVALEFVLALAAAVDDWNASQLKGKDKRTRNDFFTKLYSNDTAAFLLRMGVSHGTLVPYQDLNNEPNVAGAAINEAARLMSFAGPKQVLFGIHAAGLAEYRLHANARFGDTLVFRSKGEEYRGRQLVGSKGISSTLLTPDTERTDYNNGKNEYPPRPWLISNHSTSKITWEPVEQGSREWLEITTIVLNSYAEFVPNPGEIESPAHVGGQTVYRVADVDPKRPRILVKVLKRRRDEEQIRRLCNLQKKIADSNVFGTSYSKYLEPLKAGGKELWSVATAQSPQVAIAFRFLDEARTGSLSHFEGLSFREIESVAEQLAKLNRSLIGSQSDSMYPNFFRRKPRNWDRVIDMLRRSDATSNRTIYLARSELRLIEDIRKEVDPYVSSEKACPSTLNDFHPHNAFMRKGNCVLIIDFEAIRNDWPEEASVASALHRFCREYLRRIFVRADDTPTKMSKSQKSNVIGSACEAFLKGYAKHRSEVTDSIRTTGIQWAKAVTLAKLLGNVGHQAGMEEDLADRPEEVHFGEVVKFISYLKELNEFTFMGPGESPLQEKSGRATELRTDGATRVLAGDYAERTGFAKPLQGSAIVAGGETTNREFKSTLRMNLVTEQLDDRIEMGALKTIAAFLNSKGGVLVIGVADDHSAVGVETDKFKNEDAMQLHLVNLIRDRIGPQQMLYIDLRFEDYLGKRIFVVDCQPGKSAVYVRDGKIERFYIRTGASTTELTASQTGPYLKDRFS